MSNITQELSAILTTTHSSQPISKTNVLLQHQLDAFLSEAYQINRSISSLLKYLQAIRQPYLSTAQASRRTQKAATTPKPDTGNLFFADIPTHLTDSQREQIDSQTSTVLRDLNANITNLSSATTLQHDTETKLLQKKYGKPNSLLWRWAAGDTDDGNDPRGQDPRTAGKSAAQLEAEGKTSTTRMFRDGVLWFLSHRLQKVVRYQQDMVEIRLERERQKQMSVLYDQRNKGIRLGSRDDTTTTTTSSSFSRGEKADNGRLGGGIGDMRAHDTFNPSLDPDGQPGFLGAGPANLTPEQLQLFEEENASLLLHYNETLTKVTHAEKSLLEISSLQQTLVGHLTVQGEMIEQLVEDADKTDENVRRGNKELKKASERSSTARLVFYVTAGLCGFLITWDLIF